MAKEIDADWNQDERKVNESKTTHALGLQLESRFAGTGDDARYVSLGNGSDQGDCQPDRSQRHDRPKRPTEHVHPPSPVTFMHDKEQQADVKGDVPGDDPRSIDHESYDV